MEWVLTALGMSLLGSLHCAGMCGGFAVLSVSGNSPTFSRYFFGKTVAYTLLGFVFGIIGMAIHGAPFGSRVLAILTGLVMIVVGIQLMGFPIHLLQSTGENNGWISTIMEKTIASNSAWSKLGLGVVNALLPCGLLYAAFAAAAGLGDPLYSAAFMALFGVGTWPSLYLISRVHSRMSVMARTWMARVSGAIVVAYGLITMLRGSSLLHQLMM